MRSSFYIIINIFIPFLAAYFLSELFRNINGVIGEDIGRELQLTATELGFLTSLFLMAIVGVQLFVGIYLDRYGARRTVATLLLIGAVGAFLFSTGDFIFMAMGRFCIGLGMSACWTAAFKVNAQWWGKDKLALANGAIIGFAGLGALSATSPTEYIASIITWQSLFVWLSVLTIFVAVYIYFIAPDHKDDGKNPRKNLLGELKDYSIVFRNPVFIWVAPLSIICQGVWIGYQGLWAGAWLRQVDGLASDNAASFLFLLAICVVVGNFILGAVADRLGMRGYSRIKISLLVCAVFILVQVFISLNIENISPYLWAGFGLCVSGCILTYTLLANALPTNVGGRAMSVLNMFGTLAGFCTQYAVGFILDFWQPLEVGVYPIEAHQTAMMCIVVVQLVVLAWALYGVYVSKNKEIC